MVTEQEIKDAGADVAPRITAADVEAAIYSQWFIIAADGVPNDGYHPPVPADHPLRLMTFCVLILDNGFSIVGKSACASPENFNVEIGRKYAREDATRQVWQYLGFRLRDRLTAAKAHNFDPTGTPISGYFPTTQYRDPLES